MITFCLAKICVVYFQTKTVSFNVTFCEGEDVLRQVITSLQRSNIAIDTRRINLELYQLIDENDALINSFDQLDSAKKYTFALPHKYPAVSANEWTAVYVQELLKIVFVETSFVEQTHVLSAGAADVIRELEDVGANLKNQYDETKKLNTSEELDKYRAENMHLTSPLKKSMFAAMKFSHNEAAVDSFLNLLLFKIGFYDDWLLPVPQYRFKLEFEGVERDAICDFCVVDVVSFAVMAISEDKSVKNERVDSEGQLFGEIIAAVMQLRKRKRKSDSDEEAILSESDRKMYGLRVNGLIFHFYEVHVSDAMLEAVKTCRATTQSTEVKCHKDLNFCLKADREIIVQTLDTWREAMSNAGGRSRRLPSHAN